MKVRISLLILCLVASFSAWPKASLPTEDVEGAFDPEGIGRFDGSFVVDYTHSDYDEISLPLSPLEPTGERGERNNWVYVPGEKLDLEGSRTRLVYVLPEGISPLQTLRNYQNNVKDAGGQTLFECKSSECGGANNRSSGGGGGKQSLGMFLWPQERVTGTFHFTTGACAQTRTINDQRYAAMELGNGTGYLSVLTYTNGGGTNCGALKGRTIAVVDMMARQELGDSMVVVDPQEMAESINESGSVALYGIYFDTGKATLKSESSETLDNIALLLQSQSSLQLLVVGHTDNQGELKVNQALSEQRATAVVDALASDRGMDAARLTPLGVAFASPVASNRTEAGRALNRRVELVER